MRCVNQIVGNQLPILLIDFDDLVNLIEVGWESVTNPLDRLLTTPTRRLNRLGISYQSS